MGDPGRSHPHAARRFVVLRTSHATARLPERCRQWAETTGSAVEVVGPLAPHEVHARLASDGCAGAVLELAGVSGDTTVAAAIARAQFPVVAVSREELTGDPGYVETVCSRVIAGRGTGGFLWALAHLRALDEAPPRTLSYGPHPAHVGDLRVPKTAADAATVVLVHGGFWRHEWERDLMDGLALDLTGRGYATWNIEYRRIGRTGGGWPQSCDDVVRAVSALPMLAGQTIDPVVLLGHSAGAQLALRAAAALRDRGRPPTLVVAMSGILDLAAAATAGVGWGSIEAFMGAPAERATDAYRDAAPISHVPLGVPQLLVHGTHDVHVPPAQTEAYLRRSAAADDDIELVALDGADHFAVLDPSTDAWAAAAAAIDGFVPR